LARARRTGWVDQEHEARYQGARTLPLEPVQGVVVGSKSTSREEAQHIRALKVLDSYTSCHAAPAHPALSRLRIIYT
jgi:hypothetical protein